MTRTVCWGLWGWLLLSGSVLAQAGSEAVPETGTEAVAEPEPEPATEPVPATEAAPEPEPVPPPTYPGEPTPIVAPAPPSTSEDDRVIAEYEAAKEAHSIRRHDGFYLRFGFTIGYVSNDATAPGGIDTTSTGVGGFLDYAIGGTLGDGFVLAFGHHTIGVFSPTTKIEGVEVDFDNTTLIQVLGFMVDYFPDPEQGLHFAPTIGFGSVTILYEGRDSNDDRLGFGLGATIGYDFWIGEQWSLGAAAQVLYVNGYDDVFGEHEAFAPMVALSALYH